MTWRALSCRPGGTEHFVQVVVRVSRGAAAADRATAGLGPLWHCELCDAAAAGAYTRSFLSST